MIATRSRRAVQRGSSVVEYALIVAVVSMVLVMNLVPVQGGVCSVTNSVAQLLGGSLPGACQTGSGNGNGNGNGNQNGHGNGNGNNSGNGNGTGLGNGGPSGGG